MSFSFEIFSHLYLLKDILLEYIHTQGVLPLQLIWGQFNKGNFMNSYLVMIFYALEKGFTNRNSFACFRSLAYKGV